jgi:hypothetical protein
LPHLPHLSSNRENQHEQDTRPLHRYESTRRSLVHKPSGRLDDGPVAELSGITPRKVDVSEPTLAEIEGSHAGEEIAVCSRDDDDAFADERVRLLPETSSTSPRAVNRPRCDAVPSSTKGEVPPGESATAPLAAWTFTGDCARAVAAEAVEMRTAKAAVRNRRTEDTFIRTPPFPLAK